MIRQHATRVGAMFCVFVLGTGVSHADTVSETGFFSDLFASTGLTQLDTNNSSAIFEETEVTGIAKFDASLGTLTGVSLTAKFDTEMIASLYVDVVTDESLGHFASFNANLPQIFIGYDPTGSSSTFVFPERTFYPSLFAIGAPFESGSDEIFESASVDETTDVFASSGFVLSDFVGVGNVDTLSAIIAMPVGGDFILDNVDEVFVSVEVDMFYIDLTVEYTYTPIPEPTSLLLLMAAATGMTLRRRNRIA